MVLQAAGVPWKWPKGFFCTDENLFETKIGPSNKLSTVRHSNKASLPRYKNITVTGNRSEVYKTPLWKLEISTSETKWYRMQIVIFSPLPLDGPRNMVKLTVKVSKFFLHQLNLYQCYSLNPWKDRLLNWLSMSLLIWWTFGTNFWKYIFIAGQYEVI